MIVDKTHLATEAVDEQVGEDGGGDVDDAQAHGGGVRGGRARGDEDGDGVEHHCVDPGELLEDHEQGADTQGLEGRGREEEGVDVAILLLPRVLQALLHAHKLILGLQAAPTQPFEGTKCLVWPFKRR